MVKAVFPPEGKGGCQRREHRFLFRLERRSRHGELQGEAQERAIQALDQGLGGAQLGIAASPILRFGQQLRQGQARQAFQPGHAGLCRQRERRLYLPHASGAVLVAEQPRAQVMKERPIAATHRGARF